MFRRSVFTRLVGLERMQSQVTVAPFAPRFNSSRYKAFDADFDQESLVEARTWYESFHESLLPKGNTTYSRSSGPGGQHVNKYGLQQLYSMLPKLLYPSVRKSKYYTSANDSLTFQAQDSRSRDANAQDNRRKLTEELVRIYKDAVPAETSSEKKKKHQEM
ncbi:hypothetical protein NW752_004025 [Fusarium irregulare]|uniref:Prokaryotic-type class I peptide chain release factors domain-containing protein n=1 Tax=Fusarium irregulare TaxID=2494466 RepID=A0A9W8PSU4_9HYPO|nr:hypothetical protein NW766_005092 [Fusarium irregulare]KAJ4023560.1 hypothetical protein NW752_004025 [Fusarium irregulare]